MRHLGIRLSLILIAWFCLGLDLTQAQDQTNQEIKEHYRLGEIYYQHELYDKAQVEFQKALDLKEALTKKTYSAKQTVNVPAIKPVQPENPAKPQETPVSNEYTISPGDKLMITVWENQDLTQEVIVRPDGKISFPLINEILAQGMTLSQLDKFLTDRLTEFIRNPDVSISLKEIGGNKVIVMGEVIRPGVYALTDRKSVTEAIAMAGGFTKDAVVNSIVVISGGLTASKARRVNLNKILINGNASQDLLLASKDIVFVPKKFVSNLSYFLREIMEPLSRGMYTYTQGATM